MRISAILYLLEQFFCGVSILLTLYRLAHLPRPSSLRLALTALFGALAALLSAMHPSLPLRFGLLVLLMLAPRAVWPGLPRRMHRRLFLAMPALLMLFAGCMRFTRSLPLPYLPALLLLCLLLPAFARVPRAPSPACATLEIRRGASQVVLTALVDSGNLLRDPLSALPVVVISRRAALRLIGLPASGRLNPGLRQIAIRTIAGASRMTVFRPTSLRVLQGGVWQDVQAMVGIAPDGYNGIQALAPSSLLSTLPLAQGGTTP